MSEKSYTTDQKQNYYRSRKGFRSMKSSDVERLRELEQENARLKKIVIDLSIENATLKMGNKDT